MPQNSPIENLNPKIEISTVDIQELLNTYLKSKQVTLCDYVSFTHPKKTNGKKIITPFGRVIFNALLPEDYPYVDEQVTGSKLNKILLDIEKKYGIEKSNEIKNKVQKYLLLLSTLLTPTFEVSKLLIPEEILKKRDEIVNNIEIMTPVEFDQKVMELYKELEQFLERQGASFFDLVKSGTKGKPSDLIQLFLVHGYGIDADGNLTPPVKHSLFEGMIPEELYYGSNKARFAGYLKSVGSGEPGYLAVKLRYALNDLYVSKKTKDCKTDKYLEITVTDKIAKTILGRYYYDDKQNKLVLIDEDNVKGLIGKKIKLRSPIYCKADDGICVTCAGKMIENTGVDGHLGARVTGTVYAIILNVFQKISHQKISAGEPLDFREEIKKYYT